MPNDSTQFAPCSLLTALPGMAQIDGSRLSIGWCCFWYAVIFVGYMLCVFCLHELHVYEHTPAKYISLLIFGPLLLIWSAIAPYS